MASWNFEHLNSDLQDAAVHPERWPGVLETISAATGGNGALLFSTDERFVRPPGTPNLARMIEEYASERWYEHDMRFSGVPHLDRHGILTDLDMVTTDQIARAPYYQDFLGRHGMRWFAGVGFRVANELWLLSVQRSIAQGPFVGKEIAKLKMLCRPLGDAATMSRLLDQARVPAMTQALNVVEHAAMVCDQKGRILDLNTQAAQLIGPLYDSKQRTLRFRDGASADRFANLLSEALSRKLVGTSSILTSMVLDWYERPLALRALALEGSSSLMFFGGAVLVLLSRPKAGLDDMLLRQYGLSRTELLIAKALFDGRSVAEIAAERKIKADSVRTILKSIFAKTSTRGQAHLVAWLRRVEANLQSDQGSP
jgi:DNA-binding CsgD family transcriptional regulator